jgi:hypothetical protein
MSGKIENKEKQYFRVFAAKGAINFLVGIRKSDIGTQSSFKSDILHFTVLNFDRI